QINQHIAPVSENLGRKSAMALDVSGEGVFGHRKRDASLKMSILSTALVMSSPSTSLRTSSVETSLTIKLNEPDISSKRFLDFAFGFARNDKHPMNERYIKWYTPYLSREFEMLAFGDG